MFRNRNNWISSRIHDANNIKHENIVNSAKVTSVLFANIFMFTELYIKKQCHIINDVEWKIIKIHAFMQDSK